MLLTPNDTHADKEKGVFHDPTVTKQEKDPLAAMSDPSMMMQQQKSMFTVMLPQVLFFNAVYPYVCVCV